ncbi:hypothetical protein E4U21_004146 [Claviceps maximensis]|nr:hypothetical protein E4U21_004146 [Claviceps maximensis]
MRLIHYSSEPFALLSAVFLMAPVVSAQQQSLSTAKTTSPSPSPSNKSTPSETQKTPDSASVTSAPQTDTAAAGLTGFPTLTGPGVVPTYAPASVPPTKNAPFMQQSSLPDGTVFIVVGAILGALGLALLLWRSFATLMLHRSVERAALAQHVSDDKTSFPAPPPPFYKYSDQTSSMSLGGAGGATSAAAAGRGVRRTNRGPTPSATPSQSNLFFSPTAGAGAAPNRASAFLPSGFYAAGNSSPGGGHNQTNSIGLTNLRSDALGQYTNLSRQTVDITPPESPRHVARHEPSTSSLNDNLFPGQRPPSAYLDDLLMDDPSALPPRQMPPSSGPRRAGSPTNRF